MQVNLNLCKKGQRLLSQHGLILIYEGPTGLEPFRHRVKYQANKQGTLNLFNEKAGRAGTGSRTDDGKTFINKPLPEDHDIILVFPVGWKPPKPGDPLEWYDCIYMELMEKRRQLALSEFSTASIATNP